MRFKEANSVTKKLLQGILAFAVFHVIFICKGVLIPRIVTLALQAQLEDSTAVAVAVAVAIERFRAAL